MITTPLDVSEAEYISPPSGGIRVVVNGQPALIRPVFDYLDRGIAVLRDAPDAEFPWVFNLAYHLDGDDTHLDAANKIVGGTGDPVLVCLARRYQKARREGNVVAGPIQIPTSEEAKQEIGYRRKD